MEKFTILDAVVPHTGGCKHINLTVRDDEYGTIEEIGFHFSQFEVDTVDEGETELFKWVFNKSKEESWITVEALVSGIKNLQRT